MPFPLIGWLFCKEKKCQNVFSFRYEKNKARVIIQRPNNLDTASAPEEIQDDQ